MTKKHVPVIVVSELADAQFILQPTPVDVKTESTGSKVASTYSYTALAFKANRR